MDMYFRKGEQVYSETQDMYSVSKWKWKCKLEGVAGGGKGGGGGA